MRLRLPLFAILLTCPLYGAAVLTISSCASDTTGAIWTCHISGGGAGSLTPTSGITGFTPHLILGGAGSQIATATVTASGTGSSGTVVVSAAMPAQGGETITLDWVAGGDLTDGTNTASVQSGVSVTNNSTVTGLTLGTASAHVYKLGRWVEGPCASYGNRTCSQQAGSYTLLEFKLTVPAATTYIVAVNLSDSSTVDVQLNSGGLTGVIQGATVQKWTWNLAATLTAGTYDIKISNRSSGSPAYFDTANGIRISSSSGASCCTDMPDYDGTYYVVGTTPFSTYAQNEGATLGTGAQQGYANCLYGPNEFLWSTRWYGTGFSSLVMWVYGASGTFKLYADGVYQGAYTASGSRWGVGTISGLDTGKHLYELLAVGTAGYVYQIFATVAATIGPTKPEPRPLIAAYGDSIVYGQGLSGQPNDHSGIDYFTYPTLNLSFTAAGATGQPVSVCANGCTGSSYYLRDHVAGSLATIVKPSVTILAGGVNDEMFACGAPCTASPPAGFTTDYTTMLLNAAGKTANGGVLIARGVLPFGGGSNNSSTIADWRAAQKAAVAAYNASPTNGIQAFFIDPTGWVNTTTDLVSGLHPNDTGYAKVRLQMIPIEQAAASIHSTAWF